MKIPWTWIPWRPEIPMPLTHCQILLEDNCFFFFVIFYLENGLFAGLLFSHMHRCMDRVFPLVKVRSISKIFRLNACPKFFWRLKTSLFTNFFFCWLFWKLYSPFFVDFVQISWFCADKGFLVCPPNVRRISCNTFCAWRKSPVQRQRRKEHEKIDCLYQSLAFGHPLWSTWTVCWFHFFKLIGLWIQSRQRNSSPGGKLRWGFLSFHVVFISIFPCIAFSNCSSVHFRAWVAENWL